MRWPRVSLAVCALLALAAAALAVRVTDRLTSARVELTRIGRFAVDPADRQRLRSFDDLVSITLYISARHRMPSHLRRLERDLVDVLGAMAGASAGRLTYQVLDPDQDEAVAHRAARRRAAPVRVRSVRHDGHSERTVWSSLSIAYGPYPPAVINGLGAEDVPRLQSLILAQVDQMTRPREPVIALAAPPEYTALRAALNRRGTLIEADLDGAGSRAIPDRADVLFWIDPRRIGPVRLREIDDFLAGGRSIVVASSGQRAVPAGTADAPAVRFERREAGLAPLLSAYGLRAVEGLVVDRLHDTFEWNGAGYPAPFLVRCVTLNQDFRWMTRAPNAPLLFSAPTPLVPQGGGSARAGWTVDVVASTSEETRLLPLPVGAVPLAEAGSASAVEGEGEPVSKLPLVTVLRPDDPRLGSLLFFAAATPFENRSYGRAGTGHARLVDVLLDSLASDSRLVGIGAAAAGASASLPDLPAGYRLFWRISVLATLPALLLLATLVRALSNARLPRQVPAKRSSPRLRPRPWTRTVTLGAAGVVAAGVVSFVLGAAPGRLDLTADRLNELAPESRQIARASAAGGPVVAQLIFSDRPRLPPHLRLPVARVEQVVNAFGRVGAPLQVSTVHPEDLAAGDRAALEASGITPVEITERDADVTTVRRIYSAIRLHRGEREEVLLFPNRAAFENAEFRLAFALWRLQTGRRPHVALASDVPRLTPAEAHELFQKQGLTAPQSPDVYSVARQLLARHDFRVTHVDPREPSVPADADLLVWFQPRPPMGRMMRALTEHLHAGRPAILAAQHFNMQARQYPGRGNTIVYWPQPQWPELHTTYFPELGIHMDRVVLFDELNTVVSAESQRFRGTRREFDEQPSSLPFVIRGAAANFNRDSVITRGLGDQAFVWGNSIRLDDRRLRDNGLDATVLITTSPRTWSFAWEGGFLPEEVLEGPLPGEDGGVGYLGRMPLAVLFEGRFPLWNPPPERPPAFPGEVSPESPETEAYEPLDPASLATARPTRLLMIGGSELLKDDHILDPRFRADHLLLGAVATLAVSDEMGAVAGRRLARRGFGYVPPPQRLAWRAVVTGAAPALLLLFGAVWTMARRRPPSGSGVQTGGDAAAG